VRGDATQRIPQKVYILLSQKVEDCKPLVIGRKFSDGSVQDDLKLWPFKVSTGGSPSHSSTSHLNLIRCCP
jgi:hypothetical protein